MSNDFYPVSSPIPQPAESTLSTQSNFVARFNSLAVVSFVLAITSALTVPALILAHISLVEIKHHGERGKGLAVTALVLGYLQIAAAIALFVIFAAAFAQGLDDLQNRLNDMQQQLDVINSVSGSIPS